MTTDLLRVRDAARMLNVSRRTIYRWIEEGRLEATKLNKSSLRVYQSSIEKLMDRNRIATIGP
jgi:excisionase family DNA binding protein